MEQTMLYFLYGLATPVAFVFLLMLIFSFYITLKTLFGLLKAGYYILKIAMTKKKIKEATK